MGDSLLCQANKASDSFCCPFTHFVKRNGYQVFIISLYLYGYVAFWKSNASQPLRVWSERVKKNVVEKTRNQKSPFLS